MNNQSGSEDDRADPTARRVKAKGRATAGSNLPPGSGASNPAGTTAAKPAEPIPANSLNPDEQMEQFAKELKENDWGHQPC